MATKIYEFRLQKKDDSYSTHWILVEAETLNDAITKVQVEFPEETADSVLETRYDLIIR